MPLQPVALTNVQPAGVAPAALASKSSHKGMPVQPIPEPLPAEPAVPALPATPAPPEPALEPALPPAPAVAVPPDVPPEPPMLEPPDPLAPGAPAVPAVEGAPALPAPPFDAGSGSLSEQETKNMHASEANPKAFVMMNERLTVKAGTGHVNTEHSHIEPVPHHFSPMAENWFKRGKFGPEAPPSTAHEHRDLRLRGQREIEAGGRAIELGW